MIQKLTLNAVQSESGSGSGSTVSGTSFRTGSVAVSIDKVFGVVTDTAVPVAFTVANVQSLVMLATQDTTLKANSSGSPTDTINLKAGSPMIWQAGDGYFTSPLSGTTTMANFYVTTAASSRLQVLVISN